MPKVLTVDTKDNSNRPSMLEWLLNGLLFTFVYSFTPFFTGTQNSYFLQGLAQAGYGLLEYDWLVGTTDSKPFFSFLVEVVYELTDVYGFYVLYVLFLGIYINGIINIINYVTYGFFRKNRFYRLSLLTLLLLLHSSILHLLFDQLGFQIKSVFPEGLARQTVIDHYFQSQTFGVFLLLSIVLLLRKKYNLSVIAASFAALIHISYMLPAALITLTCMALIFFEGKNIVKAFSVGLLSLLLVSPILLYTIHTLMPLSEQAKVILYDFRIPHHANPHYWSLSRTIIKVIFMLLAILMVRERKPLFILYGSLFVFSMFLTFIQIITDSKGLALMFPWRISVILLPLAICLISAMPLKLLLTSLEKKILNDRILIAGLYILIGILAGGGCMISAKKFDVNRRFDASLLETVNQMRLPRNKSFCILIPSELEDFRLTTGLPIYVDHKSHPYRSDELEEWYERIQINERFYNHQMKEEEMAALFKTHNILYILSYRELPDSRYYQKKYANQNFILYATSIPDYP